MIENAKYIVSNKDRAILANGNFKKFWETESRKVDTWIGNSDTGHKYSFFGYKKKNEFKLDAVLFGYSSGTSLAGKSRTDQFPSFLREASTAYSVYSLYDKKGCSGIFDINKDKLLFEGLEFVDIGNIDDGLILKDVIKKCQKERIIPIGVGGTHYATKEIVEAISENDNSDKILIIYDAHQDCKYSMIEKEEINHANFVKALLERDDVKRIIQVGVRGLRSIDTVYSNEKLIKISIDEMDLLKTVLEDAKEAFPGIKGYLSVDLDVLDPIYYPYVDFPIPEGISTKELVDSIDWIFDHIDVLGCDMVEGLPTSSHASAIIPLIILAHMMDGINRKAMNITYEN